ncbi:MAG: hypothetical protein LBR65_06795, partial [Culturomica sp.]|nr:hypothetical protein [Culturomica sp.]
MKTYLRISFYFAAFTLLFASCSDFFEPDSDDKLLEGDHYKKVSEVYSAFVGTAAVFQEAASHALILNELLGAQTIPTETAPEEYWNVAKYDFSPENRLISPEPFYKVIINCNDFLRHITAFGAENPASIEEAYYKGMISQAINFRAWCYLMLGKLYGEAVYFDDAINDYRDMSGYPSLTLEQLLPELIAFVKNGTNGIGGLNGLDWSVFLNIPNDVSWNRVSVDGNVLLGEMYLWQKDYLNALRHLKVNTDITTGDQTNRWKLSAQYGSTGWRSIFAGTVGATSETITAIPFDATKNQTNPAYLAYIAMYDLAPADSLVGMFDRQVMTGGRIGDMYRKMSTIGSIRDYETMGKMGDICLKYRTESSPIIVSRAAELHLMMAEALAGLGRFEEAMILVNLGAKPYWTTVESA